MSKIAKLPVPPASAKLGPCQLSVCEWADKITAAWNKAKDGFFDAGRHLNGAKRKVEHGQWLKLVGDEQKRGMLPFGYETARCLMRIADCPAFQNPTIVGFLPNSWRACSDLARLAESRPQLWQDAVDAGVVRPDAHYIDIKHWIKARTRIERHRGIADAARMRAFEDRIFSLIYADPPWTFATRSEKGQDLTPGQHYPTMSHEEIATFKYGTRSISEIAAPDSLLFMWCTPANRMLAQEIISAWGFEYRSEAVWVKDRAGTGFYFRQQHEPLLVAVRGSPPMPIDVRSSVFEAPRGRHSEKPELVRQALEKMYPHFDETSRVELFARGSAAGWATYGFEAFAEAAE